MDSMQEVGKQNNKNGRGLYFLLGTLLGFVLSLSLYLIDKYFFPDHIYLAKTIERIVPMDKVEEVSVPEDAHVKQPRPVRKSLPAVDTLQTDSLLLSSEPYDTDLDEVDFMMEEYEYEPVSEEKIVANKRIKVHFVEMDTLKPAHATAEYFIVEQWNSPIQNRITYYRDNLLLKLKGMDVSKIEIHYMQGDYYLLNGSRYYLLNNNSTFEKLTEVAPPSLQKMD